MGSMTATTGAGVISAPGLKGTRRNWPVTGDGDDVALADAGLALLAHGGAERAGDGAGGLDRRGPRAQAEREQHDEPGGTGVGQPAEGFGFWGAEI